ncbi:MAG: nucleotidyltransferase domain-containing protein, partial [Planctomycetota bacterium]
MVSAALADDVARRIVEHFHPRRIVLFGSLARGDTREWSDIDLFVEMESDEHPVERAMAINRLFGLRDWPMDVIV